MGIFDFFKKKKKSNDFEEFSKSIDTSSFSETQKKSTENFLSDINKSLIEEDEQLNTNKIEDIIKDGESNSEERLDIFLDVNGEWGEYRVTGSENIRKTKELNDPKKYDISSLFTLNEYYDNEIIKKETKKLIAQNLYSEKFYNENGVLTKENWYLINENRLNEEFLYEDEENYEHKHHYEGGEIRHSICKDGQFHGLEKVHDKDGNLIVENKFEFGKQIYYREFANGKMIKEETEFEEEI